ncbi:patatin-like phospholipase family protein [Patescibacteria group bacterium]|nr:patatin-like phospholipase family protein [Planctomycetota bacterium]MBU1499481.1 patatin-like phospholipase family protein [Patescibacteria group bacterium]
MAKIGLVLSGGMFKGLAHVGVLKVLEENNIKVDAIAGCSMGAIIGAFYAAGKTPQEIEEFVVKQNFRSVLSLSFSTLGFSKTPKLQHLIETFSGVTKFRQLKIPLYVNATNITKEKEVVFSSGELYTAIRASIAVPGFLAPKQIKNDLYIDGGALNNIPVSNLPHNIKKYIISNVLPTEKLDGKKTVSIKDLLEKGILIMMDELTKLRLKDVPKQNYVFIPTKITDGPALPNEEKFRQIIRKGEIAARKKIPKIKRKLLK